MGVSHISGDREAAWECHTAPFGRQKISERGEKAMVSFGVLKGSLRECIHASLHGTA